MASADPKPDDLQLLRTISTPLIFVDMSSSSSLSRRTSLADYLSNLPIRPRLASLRSRKSTASSAHVQDPSSYTPYVVYQQTMHPTILRDADATAKLLEYILESPNGRRSLSRLARTCKAFKEPALNVLWRDSTRSRRSSRSSPARSSSAPAGRAKTPERDDWARLLAYGERVRSVSYAESVGNVSPTIFPIFEEHRPRTYLLPNLTSLTWRAETAAGLERCQLFLGPALQGLVLEVGTKSPKLNDLLVEIASHKGLTAFAFTLHTNLPDTFTETFRENVALEKLSLTAPGALSAKVGKWASDLPALRTFQVDLSGRTTIAVEGFFDDISPGSGYSTPSSVGGTDSGVFSGDELDFSEMRKSAVRLTRDGPRNGAFEQLSSLQLTGEAANIAMFLKHLTSPLAQIDLVMEDPPAQNDWKDRHQRVPVLRARPLDLTRGRPPMHHLPLTHLSPLPRLYRLEIDLPESILFYDEDIAHIARVCPAIEVLRLCHLARFPQPGTAPPLTLDSLVPLTRDCRRLHTLGVVVNAVEGSEETLSSREVSSRALLRLQVGHSWLTDSLQTAILLSNLTPYLESLKWFHEKNRVGVVEANALAWQKVSEFLPHLQNLRLLERRHQPQPVVYVPPPTSEKEVDATVSTVDHGMLAQPEFEESAVQVSVELVDFSVQISPEMSSVSIDATPVVAEEEISAVPEFIDHAVDVRPETGEKSTEMESISSSSSTETAVEPSTDGKHAENNTPFMFTYMPSPKRLMNFTCRVVRLYTAPLRFMFSYMPLPKFAGSPALTETEHKDEVELEKRIPLESSASSEHLNGNVVVSDISPVVVSNTPPPATTSLMDIANDPPETKLQPDEAPVNTESHVDDAPMPAQFGNPEADVSLNATRQSITSTASITRPRTTPSSFSTFLMADPKKQEKDLTKEVDALLPETKALAESGKLQDALDKLYALEKQSRNASDMASTVRLVKAALELCYAARNLELLNSSISTLSKKHGQLKTAIQAMVELAMEWLEDIRNHEGVEKWLELIETLRSVTEGKIFLETPRARVTLLLSHYHESLADSPTPTSPPRKESLQIASDLLSDLQVETYSSMERREKTEFLLEQMRLLITLARQKDSELGQEGKKDSIGGGESEWVKVRVGGRKVNEDFLKNKENEDLKLKYYDMMIQYALNKSAYLDAAKYYHKVWETPTIKEEVDGRGREALEHIVTFVVLAPHDNEQSDMLHRLSIDPALVKLDLHSALVKCFTTPELMRWPGIEEVYGPLLRKTTVFSSDKLWEDLHTRVIEHNIRIVAQYYTRITLPRLTALLNLTLPQTEETLCRLVVSGTVWARIDRPAGIINFRSSKSAEDVMNDWSSDMQRLLGLVEKTWMGVNAAQAAQSRVVKA
ncbi:26S proteasome non-ATPase regulatory subunit 12 [Grifola frondosa]|uniref:26S proteasome non-ATPase regulatory subunit 12 n=1 Tax=Grifola frondosa TaxID=5627 RepID=A0A1C7MSP0_GRIFR|nr:26S proteasome non-ATPase regulatory subunit 12 [Grifola frondosa]